MKRLALFCALAGALALGACASGGSPSQDVEKSLIGAHVTYDGISVALQTATATGILHGSAAQQAQAVYDQVGQELAAADAAWDAGNPTQAATDVASANTDAAKAATLIPGAKPPPH